MIDPCRVGFCALKSLQNVNGCQWMSILFMACKVGVSHIGSDRIGGITNFLGRKFFMATNDDAVKIFVGGLPKSCAQESLKIWAEQYGEVSNVEVKVDPMGVSRGFGFVTFFDPSVAQSIVANKDNNMMDGKWIDCKMAMPPGTAPPAGKGGKGAIDPSNPKIFVGALPKSATEESVSMFFSAFGNVTEVVVKMAEDGQCKGFAFVTFEDATSAKSVLDNYDNNMLDGKWIDCKPIVANKGKDKGFGKGDFGKGGFSKGFGGGGFGGGFGKGFNGGYGGGGCGGYGGGGCAGGYGGRVLSHEIGLLITKHCEAVYLNVGSLTSQLGFLTSPLGP